MDYIEEKIINFINKVEEYKHGYNDNINDQENLVISWKEKYSFFKLLLDIYNFIESENLLFKEYTRRINLLSELTNSKQFKDISDDLYKIATNSWNKYEDLRNRDEDFKKVYLQIVEDMDYFHDSSPLYYGIENITLDVIKNKKNYNRRQKNIFPSAIVSQIINQYNYMCLPSNMDNSLRSNYYKSLKKLKNIFSQVRIYYIDAFAVFNAFAVLLKEQFFTSHDNECELQECQLSIYSYKLVQYVLEMLEQLKIYHLKNQNSSDKDTIIIAKEKFTQIEMYILQRVKKRDSLKKIAENSNEYKLS